CQTGEVGFERLYRLRDCKSCLGWYQAKTGLSLGQCRFVAQHFSNIGCRREQAQYLFVIAEELRQKWVFEDRDTHASNIEKDGFFFALQVNIEMIDATFASTDESLHPAAVFDANKDGILCIGIGFVGKIHPCLQAEIDATSHDPQGDVRRHEATVLERNAPRLDRLESEFACVHMARTPAPATKTDVGLAAGLRRAVIEAARISLPYFHKRIAKRCAHSINDMAFDGDAFSSGFLTVERAGPEVLLEDAVDPDKVRGQTNMDIRACGLCGGCFRIGERLRHISCPPGDFRRGLSDDRVTRCRTCKRAYPSANWRSYPAVRPTARQPICPGWS